MFEDFMDTIVSEIEQKHVPGEYNNTRVIMWNTISLYRTLYITTTIQDLNSDNLFSLVNLPAY